MFNILGNNDEEESKKAIDTFKDPFTKDNVDRINITLTNSKSFFREGFKNSAEIHFENGNTSGRHEVYSDSFPDLMKQVEDFVKSLD